MDVLLVLLPMFALVLLLLPMLGEEFAPVAAFFERLGISPGTLGWILAIAWSFLIAWNIYLGIKKAAAKRKLADERQRMTKLAGERAEKKAKVIAEIIRLRNDTSLEYAEREAAIQRLEAELHWILSDDTR